MGKAKLVGCLCEYCTNLQLKLKVINTHQSAKQAETIPNLYSLCNITLCKDKKPSGSKYHHPSCMNRKCPDCGVRKLHNFLDPLEDTLDMEITWKRWELVTQEVKKGNTINKVKKRGLVCKTKTMRVLLAELEKEIEPFPEHLFNKDWQNDQLQNLRQNMPNNAILSILDFAENYTCRYQNEAQGAYWTQESATIHPFVTYYKCQNSSCTDTVTESVVVISNDLTHDHHAVHAFQKAVVHHRTTKRNLHIDKMYQFSDCCAVQYRSKGPFSDISYGVTDYKIPIQHNYSGERHGKGASDGESAVIKSNATTAVKVGRALIRNAEELYGYAKDNLTKDMSSSTEACTHFLRTLVYVPREDVKRDRSDRFIRQVDGSSKLHCVKTVREGVLATRNLTCFCEACLDGHGVCANELYVSNWKEVKLYSTRGKIKQYKYHT